MVRSVCSQTNPAELKGTEVACHVVATFILFNTSFTAGTESDISGFCPVLKLVIYCLLAGTEVTVPRIATLETYLLATLAGYKLSGHLSSLHVFATVFLWTPLQKCIRVYHFHFFEFQILLQDFLVFSKNILDVLQSEGICAILVKAFHLVDLCFLNQHF